MIQEALKLKREVVHRFYPWESKYALVEPYNYIDVSIYDYLKRSKEDGMSTNMCRSGIIFDIFTILVLTKRIKRRV